MSVLIHLLNHTKAVTSLQEIYPVNISRQTTHTLWIGIVHRVCMNFVRNCTTFYLLIIITHTTPTIYAQIIVDSVDNLHVNGVCPPISLLSNTAFYVLWRALWIKFKS